MTVNNLANKLDFKHVVAAMRSAPKAGDGAITLLGGELESAAGSSLEQQLSGLITALDLSELPWRIVETMGSFRILKGELPASWQEFQRLRFFGPGGDLEVRRDGSRAFWRLIGPPGLLPPPGFPARDYWDQHPDDSFRVQETTVLLWGERNDNTGFWIEDRVAKAGLVYPELKAGRVQARARVYLQAGQPAFVWLLGLEPQEAQDAKG